MILIPNIIPKCPICGHYIPNDNNPGEHPGSISRVDNVTEICNQCGFNQAVEALKQMGIPAPQY